LHDYLAGQMFFRISTLKCREYAKTEGIARAARDSRRVCRHLGSSEKFLFCQDSWTFKKVEYIML
jgi:hypothetical protein